MTAENSNNTEQNVSVAAVVVTWNRVDNALRWIAAIKAQTYPVSEIVVVDNGSNDNTVCTIQEQHPDVNVIAIEENLGHAGGAQRGIEEAMKGEYQWFWMFDDDAFPAKTALQKCIATAEQVKQNKPALIYAPSSNEAGWNWKGYKVPVKFETTGSEQLPPIQVAQVDFNMTLLAAEAVKTIGLPYGDYFMMGWEIEYCMRAAKGGYSCWVVPEILVNHEHAGYKQQASWRAFYQSRNHVLTTRKHPSVSNIIWCALRQSRYILGACRRLRTRRELLMMRTNGVIDGLLGRQGKTVDPAKFVQ